jgi:hypothetical protein
MAIRPPAPIIAPISGAPEQRLQALADQITRAVVGLSVRPTNGEADAAYVNVSGDTMTGVLTLSGDPTTLLEAATKQYVDTAISTYSVFRGNWQVAANVPDISGGGTQNAENYLCETANPSTPEVAPAGIPGIGGQTISDGDRITWVAASAVWSLTRSSALTKSEGDALYVDVVGDTMTGLLTLSGPPTAALHAATKAYVDAHGVITWNGRAGNVTMTAADVTPIADPLYVNVAGDTMTGALTLNADPTAAMIAATKQYVDAQIATLLGYINELGQRQNNAGAAQPADPAATGSAVNVMMGFNLPLTIGQRTTRAMLFASGEIANSANNGQSWCSLWYGAGAAPAYGQPVPGGATRVSGEIHFDASSNQQVTSFAIEGLATGLTPGTPIWLDMAVRAQGGNASVSQVEIMGMGLIDTMVFP